jgi:replicative DNA helicase
MFEKSPPKNTETVDLIRRVPHNVEAEQALLGAIFLNNDAYDRISDKLAAEHFFDPLHQRIYHAIHKFLTDGKRVTPVTLKPVFEVEEAIGALTVPQYLGRLAANATSVINARDYAATIYDLWVRRKLISIGEDIANTAYVADLDAPTAGQIDEAESRLFSLSGMGAQKSHEYSAMTAADSAIEMISAAYQHNSGLAGLSTGLIDLDRAIGGLSPENLVILAGRPSMGKSALAAGIAFSVAKTLKCDFQKISGGRGADLPIHPAEGVRCGEVSFYSLEMSAEQLMQRQLAVETEIPADRQRRGNINEDEFLRLRDAARKLGELPLHIDATGALTMAQLTARARRRKRLFDTRLLIVDYLQLMASGRNRDNRASEVAEISMGLKALAKELKIPVLALSQLSREVERREDKRPQLSDLRESGAIEQDADIVMFVFREEYYLNRAEPPESKVDQHNEWSVSLESCRNLAEVILGKHRHGSVGTVKLHFAGEKTLFSDLESRH